MKKTVTVLLLLVAAGLIATGIWLSFTQSPAQQRLHTCKTLVSQNAQLIHALKDRSCDGLGDAEDRATCTAWTTKNPASCPEESKHSCLAIVAGNPDACNDGDVWCAALAADNAQLCGTLADAGEAQECAAWVNRDASFFENDDCADAALVDAT